MLSTSQIQSRRYVAKLACASRGKPPYTSIATTGVRRYTSSQPAKANEEPADPADQPSSEASSSLAAAKQRPNIRSIGSSSQDPSVLQALYQHTGYSAPKTATKRIKNTPWNRMVGKLEVPLVNLIQDAPPEDLKSSLRSLLREVAQPVAVVTSYMPQQEHETPQNLAPTPSPKPAESHRFHGATLSSFSSIAMDPHPLVAFALRVPSRMATTLSALVPTVLSPSSLPSEQSSPVVASDDPTHLVLNILSSSQQTLAHAFSRPDVHPHPFESASYTLSPDGLPILDRALGALSCKIVARVELSKLGRAEEPQNGLSGQSHGQGVASELFIAQVVRVEGVVDKRQTPLLYWQRGYTKVDRRSVR